MKIEEIFCMKKRLRKKLRLGEFQETGALVAYEVREDMDHEGEHQLLDRFVMEALEGNGLDCVGFPPLSEAKGFHGLLLSEGFRGKVDEEQVGKVRDWLAADKEITAYCIGPIMDAWYGDFEQDLTGLWIRK